MNAVITYMLTEQAQRAQMAATGQPVARKQTVTVDVPTEDLNLMQVDADGTPFLDLTKAITSLDLLNAAGIGAHISESPYTAINVAEPDILAALKLGRAKIAQAARTEQEKKAAAMAANLAEQMAAVEKFFSDPTARIQDRSAKLGDNTYYIFSQRIAKVDFTDQPACPRFSELIAEAERRNAADNEARAAKQAEADRLNAEKEAKEAAKEAAKQEFLGNWIAGYGSQSQKARNAEGLLCRDEAIKALADATFTSVNGTAYCTDFRPCVDCTCDDCHDDCETRYEVKDSVDCLNEVEYERLGNLKASFISHDFMKFVLRTRTAVHDCDHSPKCSAGERHTCLVKATVGPFTLQREYAI